MEWDFEEAEAKAKVVSDEAKAWWQKAIDWVKEHPGTVIVLGAAAVVLASCVF